VCIENYLIDDKIIYDMLSDREISKDRIENRGEVQKLFRDIAVSQLQEVIAVEAYHALAYDDLGLRPKEILGKAYPEIADVLFSRVNVLKTQICGLVEADWKNDFISRCKAEHAKREAAWESDWLIHCDGKRFFRDLHQRYGVKISPLKFKKLIVERMQREQTDAWVLVEKLLSDALRVA